ncbi:Chaperone protein dnaJ gfa2, mitochondrial [Sarracenia purpurea var. burkii]
MVDLIVNIEPRLDGLCEVHYEQADGLCKLGVDDNETTKVFRSGGADPDGNQPGDLYVIIKVREDPVFRRDVADIHVNAVLSITQAILGGTIQVPTLRGDVVLKVRAGT